MAKRKTPLSLPIDGNVKPALLIAIRFFALIAMGISAYLAWITLNGSSVAGCGPESDCDKVLQSRWSKWFGLPVSLVALMVYSLILGASFRLSRGTPPPLQRKAWLWLLPCAMVVVAAALWFVGLQLFVLRAFCPYCMAAHTCGFITALLLLKAAPIHRASGKSWELDDLVFIPPRTFRQSLGIALVAIALLVIGGFLHKPVTGEVAAIVPGTNGPAVVGNAVASTNTSPARTETNVTVAATPARRMFPVYNGRFELDLNQVPTIGSFTNDQVIVSLFDYTCHHCRAMHPDLVGVQGIFSNRLCIISLPMPLDPGCNSTMQRAHPSHTNACEYAKLGLAVWRADRTKHHDFDEFLMTGEKPPAITEARERAALLLGPAVLEKTLQDPWVAQQLQMNVAIYELAYRAGRGQMPQLMVGSNVAVGTFRGPELLGLLTNNLVLVPR